jgi:uncharacterized cupin superfamily protein
MNMLLRMTGLAALLLSAATVAETVHPAKISKADAAGAIFQHPGMEAITHEDGHQTEDVTTLLSSDGRFASGMYKSGKTRAEVTEPWGVDEFMYFLEGGATLISSDGTVTEVSAGEAVTVPREWTGTWVTDGYTKIWVIYSEDGSALE